MIDDPDAPRRSSALILAAATLQGLAFYWLSRSIADGVWPATDIAATAVLYAIGIFLAPVVYLLRNWARRGLMWMFVAAIALLLIFTALEYGWHRTNPPDTDFAWRIGAPPFTLLLLDFLTLFHAVPFLQIRLRSDVWRPGYPELFERTWLNAIELALAALFAGIFWLMLVLAAQLFDMIGIDFLRVVLLSAGAELSLFIVALGFGIGIHLTGSAQRMLTPLRRQVLTLLKWLLPVGAVILALFSLALLVKAPFLLAQQRHLISATWLLWLAAVTVYLFNAAYQDGGEGAPYPRWLNAAIRFTTPLLVLIAAMAGYALLVRIANYGLTVTRVWGLVVAALISAYVIAYAVAARRAEPWMGGMGRGNVWIAVGLIVVLIVTQTPLLSPERLTAMNVAARFAGNRSKSERADLMLLRFDTGHYGREKLDELVAAAVIAQDPARRALVAAAMKVTEGERYGWTTPSVEPTQLVFAAYPAGTAVDPALRAAIASEFKWRLEAFMPAAVSVDSVDSDDGTFVKKAAAYECSKETPCTVLFVDLDGMPPLEAVVFVRNEGHAFRQEGANWSPFATVDACPGLKPGALARQLAANPLVATAPATPQLKDVRIGKYLLHVTPSSRCGEATRIDSE